MDEFTQRLLEKSKARKDFLNSQKIPELRKRTALIDESQISLSNLEFESHNDDSPKRPCLEYGETNNSRLKSYDDKENSLTDDIPFVPFVASEKRGLAALRKRNYEEPRDSSSAVKTKVTFSSDSSSNNEKRLPKSRLAALAAEIRDWEDDSSSNSFTPPQSSSSLSSSLSSISSSSSTDSSSNNRHSKRSDFSSSKNNTVINVPSNASQTPSKNNAVLKKVEVWDQAILATLESQGFVKSPSKNKLAYKFSPPTDSEEEESSDEKMHEDYQAETIPEKKVRTEIPEKLQIKTPENLKREISPLKNYKVLSEEKKNNVINGNKQTAISSEKIVTPQKVADVQSFRNTPFTQPNSKGTETTETEEKDPAELPLSARKAIFERAMFNSPLKSDTNLTPNLSISQRAAMFEKTPQNDQHKRNLKEPFKNSVPPKPVSNVCEQKSPINLIPRSNLISASPLKSPQSPIETPSKNAGVHTRLIQQKLIDNSTNDWRKKDIVAKASEERKTEISALLSHWEKVSTSEQNVPEMESKPKHTVSFEPDKDISGYSENSNDFQESYNESIDQENDDFIHEEDEEEEVFLPQKENTNENVSPNITEDVLTERDKVFESTSNQNSSPLPPPLPAQSCIIPSSASFSSKGSSISYTSSSSESTSYQQEASKYQSPIVMNDNQTDKESDTPLLHTISFYRKQKQKITKPPVPTIIRKVEVPSPPSPETDSTKIIQEKIKALQEEILTQQTVISQTSQALNLCHATEEFYGSTEQIEGERLLLIATQKRQAALNEIHRLKTHGALGEKLEFGSGTLLIHDITLPLKRDFIASQLQNKDNDAVHYFLCLVRYGHQVIVTQMLSTLPSDVTNGRLCFTNHITLRNLPPDFSIVFEVYALQTKKEVLPHAKKYHIKKEYSKIRLTPKSKKESKLQMPVISSPGGPNAVRTPSFGVVGYTRFTLQNYDRKTYTLDQVPFSSPLDGVLLLKMQLHCERNITEQGFLTMFEDVSGLGAWYRRWCSLNDNYLSFWKYPDEEKKKEPILRIDMRQCITNQVKLVSRDICARANTFELVTVRPQEDGDKNTLISRSVNTLTTTKYLLSADTKEERILWCKRLNEALTNIRRWNPRAMRPLSEMKK